jgi:nicotinate dehydrogenase subunit A
MNKPAIEAADHGRGLAARSFCSYTNDVARGPKSCQAAPAAKKSDCRKIIRLPCHAGHKAGNAAARDRALARLYTNGIFRRRPAQGFAAQRGQRSMTQSTTRLTVNGMACDVDAAPDTALLYVLRNDLALNGPKYGCGLGECGSCAVLIDGVAARACVTPIEGCIGRDIVTLEGLGTRSRPDPVQQAFIDEQAAQCGYCLNGMIIATKALLLRSSCPSEAEVMEALRHQLCRCGAHVEIMRAAMRVAGHIVEAQT